MTRSSFSFVWEKIHSIMKNGDLVSTFYNRKCVCGFQFFCFSMIVKDQRKSRNTFHNGINNGRIIGYMNV